MQKISIVSLLIILCLFPIVSEGVNWYSEYDQALAAAKEEGKNIFVLITAPSWCGWCVRLEDNVLSKPEFQTYLSEHYIPLMLLDVVDGRRNPELRHFDFGGYPSVFLYDADGLYIDNIYTQSLETMMESLVLHKDSTGRFRPRLSELKLPDKFAFLDKEEGEFINNHNGATWTKKADGQEILYRQGYYDFEFLYLNALSGQYRIALPMRGGMAHIATIEEDQWVWSRLGAVTVIGGDEYFQSSDY